MTSKIEAARVIFRHGDQGEAISLLQHIWENPENQTQAFEAFLGLLEVWVRQDKESTQLFLEEMVSGYGTHLKFWDACSLSEQAVVFEWLGQIQYQTRHFESAFESLSRSASLGRDTSLLWRLLGELCLERSELDLGVRYIKRSLDLYRQMDLEILSGRSYAIGSFTGRDPLKWSHGAEDYLKVLLSVTRLAKGRKNLKLARELVLEMLHQFPEESRLPKLRLMIEKSIVEHSLFRPGAQASRPAQIQ